MIDDGGGGGTGQISSGVPDIMDEVADLYLDCRAAERAIHDALTVANDLLDGAGVFRDLVESFLSRWGAVADCHSDLVGLSGQAVRLYAADLRAAGAGHRAGVGPR